MVSRAYAGNYTLPIRSVDDSQRAFSARGRRPAPIDARDRRAVDFGRGSCRVGGVGHVAGFVHVVYRFTIFGHVERGLVLLSALLASPVEEEET